MNSCACYTFFVDRDAARKPSYRAQELRGRGVLAGLNPRILLLALIAVLLIAALTFIIRSCSSSSDKGSVDVGGGQQQAIGGDGADEGSIDESEEPEIDQAALASIMGDDLAAQMVELSAGNEDLYWIASRPEAVGVDGAKAQRKLLKLATVEPAAITFVRDYPDLYPDDTTDACDPLSADVDIPLLMQWDQRWGYTVYSSAAFGQTGCCPTCMAMVYQGITRKTDMSPYDMGQLSRERGFMAQYAGTDSQFLLSCASELGLKSSKISVSEDALRDVLSAGNVVIANVGPGDFTEGGHFIVLAGLDADGMVVVNDPYSVKNSERTWSVGEIIGQTKRLFVFER